MAQPVKLNFSAPRRGLPPKHFADLSESERIDKLAEIGLPKFRAKQLAKHYYEHYTDNVEDMTDIPAGKREAVKEAFFPELMKPIRTTSTDDGETTKSLWRLHDGTLLESVLMRYPGRATLCISSQAGCGMACPFCATGQGGLDRNLSTGEIVEQFRHAASAMAAEGGRLSNVVFMGMGEPMANYRSVLTVIRTLTADGPDGMGMSARALTVSTVGLVPRIKALTEERIPVTLAVSLHAPDDELRDELIPVNRRWKVDELLDAAWHYAEKSKRRVSIEYALMKDINDQADRAAVLARQIRRRGDWTWAHVNLIPLNPTPGSRWTASRREDQDAFVETLERWKIPVTVRDTRGSEIDGACGQLAAVGRSEGLGS